MQRRCEPELMDEPLQAAAYAAADFSASDAAFSERILALLAAAPAAPPPVWSATVGSAPVEARRILDLGCGPGNITFRLASALPQASVLGLDGAAAMLALAERRRQAGPQRWPRLRFQLARLPLPPGALAGEPGPFAPPYHLLVSNSLLHHLHDPAVLWRAVAQLAAPGALVVVRDLRRPASPAALAELVERHAATAPAVLRRDYANSLAAAFTPREVEAQLVAAGLASLRVAPLADRYLDVWGWLPA
ncbi:MAG: class I SAM-dependent methyltransferase [Cyanobacteriota bacterium]|nr:class I SAM-dependent methyltransferase [Cyanobacteriota bacterium]